MKDKKIYIRKCIKILYLLLFLCAFSIFAIIHFTKDDSKTIVVMINGKLRDKFEVSAGTAKDELEKLACATEGARKYMEGKTVVKTVVVQDKLVNIVVK